MELAEVQQAAQTRRTAESDYRSAVLASVKASGTAATATAAGVSRQAVAQMVRRFETNLGSGKAASEEIPSAT